MWGLASNEGLGVTARAALKQASSCLLSSSQGLSGKFVSTGFVVVEVERFEKARRRDGCPRGR